MISQRKDRYAVQFTFVPISFRLKNKNSQKTPSTDKGVKTRRVFRLSQTPQEE